MAKFLSTTFGRISGRHGTAVAAVCNGEAVIRVYTPPSNPNTMAQQSQRLKFGLIINSLSPLRNIITIGFGNKKGFYQATSLALRSAVTGTYPDFSVNYAKVILSSGSLPQSPAVNISVLAKTNASVEWDTYVWGNGSPDDVVFVAFLNSVNQMVVFAEAQAKRQEGKLTILLPELWIGVSVHAWFFFASADRKLSSVSQYLGTVIPG